MNTQEIIKEFEIFQLDDILEEIQEEREVYIIDNRLDLSSEEKIQEIEEAISLTVPKSSKIDIAAKCQKGCLEGNYLVGKRCPNCNTVVQFEDPLYRPNAWYQVEEESDYRFLHTYFYTSLAIFFNEHRMDFLKFITNKALSTNSKYNYIASIFEEVYSETLVEEYKDRPKDLELALQVPFRRSIEFFKNNWLTILTRIANSDEYDFSELHNLLNYFLDRKDLLYSRSLPLPPKRLITIERSKAKKLTAVEVAKRLTKLVNIHTMSGCTNRYKELDYLNVELASLWMKMGKNRKGIISSKQGLVRHNIGSTSIIYGFRCEITLLNGKEASAPDEIHAPYSMMVAILRFHIQNILAKRHKQPIFKFRARLNRAVRNFDQEIYDIMENDIVKSNVIKADPAVEGSVDRTGLIVISQRNPSQNSSSYRTLYLTHIKEDPNITTVSEPPITVEAMNGDIDG